jgi:hypothetical protein
MEDCFVRISNQLNTLAAVESNNNSSSGNKDKSFVKKSSWTLEEIVNQIEKLVQNQQQLRILQHEVESTLSNDPDNPVSKVIVHFMHLFDVKNVQGVLPKMNEVYLYASEVKTALHMMRQLLSLDASVPVGVVVGAVKTLLDQNAELSNSIADSNINRRPSTDGTSSSSSSVPDASGIGNDSAPSSPAQVKNIPNPISHPSTINSTSTSSTSSTAAAAGASAHAQSTAFVVSLNSPSKSPRSATDANSNSNNTAEQSKYFKMMMQLKEYLNVSEMKTVVPLVKRLIGRVRMYDEIFPGIDKLVSTLYQVLDVTELDAIIPAVKMMQDYIANTSVRTRSGTNISTESDSDSVH